MSRGEGLDEAARQRVALAAARVLRKLDGKKADPRYERYIEAHEASERTGSQQAP